MQFITMTANTTTKKLMFIIASFLRILLTNPEYSLSFPRISKMKYMTSFMSCTEVKRMSANLALPSRENLNKTGAASLFFYSLVSTKVIKSNTAYKLPAAVAI